MFARPRPLRGNFATKPIYVAAQLAQTLLVSEAQTVLAIEVEFDFEVKPHPRREHHQIEFLRFRNISCRALGNLTNVKVGEKNHSRMNF